MERRSGSERVEIAMIILLGLICLGLAIGHIVWERAHPCVKYRHEVVPAYCFAIIGNTSVLVPCGEEDAEECEERK